MQEYERAFVAVPLPGEPLLATRDRLVDPVLDAVEFRELLIHDTYLECLDDMEPLRLRRVEDEDGKRTAEFAVKTGAKPDRREIRWSATGALVFGGAAIYKTRCEWKVGACVQHIDRVVLPMLEDATQMVGFLMEIEGPPDEVNAFVPPEGWLEVTSDPRYGAYTIATKGWPT